LGIAEAEIENQEEKGTNWCYSSFSFSFSDNPLNICNIIAILHKLYVSNEVNELHISGGISGIILMSNSFC